MNELTIFNYDKNEVRTVTLEGEPWFVGKDIAEALGYKNTADAIRKHCKKGQPVGVRDLLTPNSRGNETVPPLDQQTIIIPERDVYRLIMRSKLPSAEKFEEWVVGEVLPSIRKTGSFASKLPDFTNPAIAARAWADQVESNQQLQITLTEQAPLVSFAETVQASTKAIKIGDFVKLISNKTGFVIGRNNFFEWLRFEKIIERRSMPFQRYIDNGWFEVKEATYENINTNGPQVCFTTLVTGFGQIQLLERFKKSDTFKSFLNKKARMNSQGKISQEVTA